MAVSKFTSTSAANDFNVNVGSAYSVVNFTQEYPSGAYSFTSAQLDTTMDVYIYNALGTLVGYTNGKGLIASGGFNKMIIIGGTVSDVLSFSYKTTFTSVAETSEITTGPVILSTTPLSLPNVNSSTTVTGLNFATDITATFTGTDNLVRNAKSVVRGSANSLVVTRPDVMPVTYSPYTLTVTNPSVSYQPTGSNAHTISVTAGVNPIWVTAAGPLSTAITTSAYSTTVSATDADGGSSLTYAVTSGALPTGITLNSTTGVISGTAPIGSNGSYSFAITATDSGGNTTSRSFSIPVIGYINLTFTVGGTGNTSNATITGNGTTSISAYKTSGSTSPWNLTAYNTSTVTAPFSIEFRKYGPSTDDSTAYTMSGITPSSALSNQLANASSEYQFMASWYPVATNGGLSVYEYSNYTGNANSYTPSDVSGNNYTSGDTFRISVAADGTITYWHGSNTTPARTSSKSDLTFYPSVALYSVNGTNGGVFAYKVNQGAVWNAATQTYVAG